MFFVYDKSQVQEKVKIFVRRAQREFGLPIKKIKSDNGTKFKNTLVEEFLNDEGIKHEFCHRTDQFIRAQVQKQSPKRSNSRT